MSDTTDRIAALEARVAALEGLLREVATLAATASAARATSEDILGNARPGWRIPDKYRHAPDGHWRSDQEVYADGIDALGRARDAERKLAKLGASE